MFLLTRQPKKAATPPRDTPTAPALRDQRKDTILVEQGGRMIPRRVRYYQECGSPPISYL